MDLTWQLYKILCWRAIALKHCLVHNKTLLLENFHLVWIICINTSTTFFIQRFLRCFICFIKSTFSTFLGGSTFFHLWQIALPIFLINKVGDWWLTEPFLHSIIHVQFLNIRWGELGGRDQLENVYQQGSSHENIWILGSFHRIWLYF